MSVTFDLADLNPTLSTATHYVYGVLDSDTPDWSSVTDSAAGIMSAIAALPRGWYSRPKLYLPAGYSFRLSQTLEIDDPASACVDLDGQGCCLVADDGVDAINIEVDYLNENTDPKYHANATIVRNVTLRNRSAAGTNTATGIRVRAALVAMYDIRIFQFGIGLHVHSIATGNPQYNANYGKLHNVACHNCTVAAIKTQGSDSNQWVLSGLTVLGGRGIDESSFLGNLYLGPSCEGTSTADPDNDFSIRHTGGTNCSTYVHWYLEEGDPAPWFDSPSPLGVFLGGNGIRELGVDVQRVGYNSSGLLFRPPADVRGSAWNELSIGRSLTDLLFFQRKGSAAEAYGWGLRFISGSPSKWAIRSERNTDQSTPFAWTADIAPASPGQIYPGISAADGGTIATSESLTAFFQSMLLPSGSGLAVPGATMGPTNDSTACAIDAQEFSDFSEAISLGLLVNDRTQYPRAIKALDVTSGTTLQVTTINGNTRNLTVSAGELVELQCVSIGTGTDCDLVRVYW